MTLPKSATTQELCELLNVSRKTVAQWTRDGFLRRVEHGRYDLADSVRGYAKHERERVERSGGGDTTAIGDVARARKRVLTAQAERLEDALAVDRRDLVNRNDVAQEICDTFREVRNGLLRVPPRIAQTLPHLSRADLDALDAEIRIVLTAIGEGRTVESVIGSTEGDRT